VVEFGVAQTVVIGVPIPGLVTFTGWAPMRQARYVRFV
jgi:hypothetical protein